MSHTSTTSTIFGVSLSSIIRTDPDLIADEEDALRDYESHTELWRAYHSRSDPNSNLKNEIAPEKWAEYEARFDRCRRIEALRQAPSPLVIGMREWLKDPKNEEAFRTGKSTCDPRKVQLHLDILENPRNYGGSMQMSDDSEAVLRLYPGFAKVLGKDRK
jgi:hypothetical protein